MVAKELVVIVLIVLDAGLSARRRVVRRSGGGRAGAWHLHARRRGPSRRRGETGAVLGGSPFGERWRRPLAGARKGKAWRTTAWRLHGGRRREALGLLCSRKR
jgi:hypothetical protein